MRMVKAQRRLLAAVALAGATGARTIELMDATGVKSGDFYTAMHGLSIVGWVRSEEDGDRTRFWATEPGRQFWAAEVGEPTSAAMCPVCEGSGITYTYKGGPKTEKRMLCSECGGTGDVIDWPSRSA